MKRLILFIVMLCAIVHTYAQYNSSVMGGSKEIVAVRSTGYGKKAQIAFEDAELSAIRVLLYTGAANTMYSMPLIQDSRTKVENEHKQAFDDLYGGEYKQFVESTVIVTPFGKNSLKQKCITVDVSIRVPQLRTWLERSGIIRKFGL